MKLTPASPVDGLVEHRLDLDGIPGFLWMPPTATPSTPVPLVLAGQPAGPAGIERTRPRILERAARAAQADMATVTLELPGAGGRPAPDGVADARADLRQALQRGTPVPEDVIERLILPLVDAAVPESRALLDALPAIPELDGHVGVSGGVISIGTVLAARDPRVRAAVLFAGSYVPRSVIDAARTVTIPVHVLLQWDDEGNDRQRALDLFDAFGSTDKSLAANLGGHTGVPAHAGEEATRFLARHLLANP